MPGIEDNIRSGLERLGRPADPEGALEKIARRRSRRGAVRRVQIAALAVAVVAGTVGGTYALTRVFGGGTSTPLHPGPLTGNGRIAFVSNRDGNDEIYTMNPDGTGVRRLTHDPAADTAPAWSPDGSMIAFSSDRNGESGIYVRGRSGRSGIYVMNADGTGVRRLTYGDNAFASAWSPDGTRIAFTASPVEGPPGVFVMNADGTGVKRLSPTTQTAGFVKGRDVFPTSAPSWSPDGSKLAYEAGGALGSCKPNVSCLLPLVGHIFVVSLADGGIDQVTNGEAEARPSWSPDGRLIAFDNDPGSGGAKRTISVVTPDGRRTTTLSSSLDFQPSWSPDGKFITFASGRKVSGMVGEAVTHTAIYVMNADGSGVRQLTSNAAADRYPVWQPVSAGGPTPSVEPSATESPAHEPSASPTESPSPEPTPTAIPSGEPPFIGYACGSSEIHADFDGDGTPDTAMVHFGDVFQGTPPSCPSADPTQTYDWKVDVKWGDGVAGQWPLPECDVSCRAHATFDLDGNGTAELALVIHEGASTDFLNFFELPPEEPGPILFAEASQSKALELAVGGSVTHLDFVTCSTDGSGGPQLISTNAGLSQDGSTWTLTETVYAFDASAPASGSPRMAEAFSIVSTNTSTQAADPNGAPPTVYGSPCFVPEG